jgi:hypothetical protein
MIKIITANDNELILKTKELFQEYAIRVTIGRFVTSEYVSQKRRIRCICR